MYGNPSPAAIAFAPIVLPVPAGPRKRKLRICIGLPVVIFACLHISTTSSGMMYQSGRVGTSCFSIGESVLACSSYLPTKSECSTKELAFFIVAGPVFANIVNSPATTLVGIKLPESICACETRIRLPDLSTSTLTYALHDSSLIRRYALSHIYAILIVAMSISGCPLMNWS